jgi:hypothetical protein
MWEKWQTRITEMHLHQKTKQNAMGPNPVEVIITEIQAYMVPSNGTTV